MKTQRLTLVVAVMAALAALPGVHSPNVLAADAAVVQPKEGWYKTLVDFDFMRQNVSIPPKNGSPR